MTDQTKTKLKEKFNQGCGYVIAAAVCVLSAFFLAGVAGLICRVIRIGWHLGLGR